MPIEEVIMPQMGESIAEGTLTRWLKKEGEKVSRDEPLFEISTDKVDSEIPSPGDGVLQEIKVHEGETVPVKAVVALLNTEGSGKATASAPTASAPVETGAAPAPVADSLPPAAKPAPAMAAPLAATAVAAAAPLETREERLVRRSSPLVRRIAREHGIDIGQIQGSGTSGRVTKNDILGFIDSGGAAQAAVSVATPSLTPAGNGVRAERLSGMRQKIAEHMVFSKQTSPHVTTVFEVDMTEVAELIKENKQAFLAANGVKLTFTSFIMKASTAALRAFPIVNASLSDNTVQYHPKIHLGIAVALKDGLIVPVIKAAEEKNLIGLARSLTDLATRARSKKLQPDEVQGGTFTITNHGMFGSLFATPIINQPQVGILGVGTITKRPVVLPGTDSIAIRSMMYLALSFDHRLIDGAIADQFVAHIKNDLENPANSPLNS